MSNNTEIIKKEELPVILIEEKQFYEDVREILLQARELAYKNASSIMTQAYWNVGKRIVEQELLEKERAKYGSYLIKNSGILWICNDAKSTMVSFEKYYAYTRRRRTQFLLE